MGVAGGLVEAGGEGVTFGGVAGPAGGSVPAGASRAALMWMEMRRTLTGFGRCGRGRGLGG